MYKDSLLGKLRINTSNLLGASLSRKIIVIQSDDWGSTRTYDKSAFDRMDQFGLNVASNNAGLDCLESNEDLEALFNLLLSFKDINGKHPVITGYCAMANPDFKKIEDSEFKEYHFETLDKTVRDYPNHDKLLEYWKKGVELGIFSPQLHAREHLHIQRWMEMLNWEDGGLKFAFQNKSVGPSKFKSINYLNYAGAFYPIKKEEVKGLHDILLGAGELYKMYLGCEPKSFVAPNAEEPEELTQTLAKLGVKVVTRPKQRKYPLGDNEFKTQINWPGKLNSSNQVTLVRNAFFEPCAFGSKNSHTNSITDWVDNCMKEIEVAFRWKKPVVISSHRWNYVGSIRLENRDKGLKELKRLLTQVLKKWPDVEFMTSAELGDLMSKQP